VPHQHSWQPRVQNTGEDDGQAVCVAIRKHFSRVALSALYDNCHAEVEKDISTAKYFATTTDLWSSRTMEPYISLTVHYMHWLFF